MTFLLRGWRILAIALLFVSLALGLSFLRPLLRLYRRGVTKDQIVTRHLRGICRVMGIRIHLRGARFPGQNFLLLANHLSYLDIIILGSLAPMSFMAKEEIKSWPVIGFLAKRGRAVFVGRDSVSARLKALHQARVLLKEESICIFPEGTTSSARSPSIDRWYRGNVALGKDHPLVCAGLHYRDQKALAWIDDQELVPHLFQVLGRKRIDVFIITNVLAAPKEISLKGMSQLAHQMICRLTDSAYSHARESELFSKSSEEARFEARDSLYQIR